jgi:hypothetical protein
MILTGVTVSLLVTFVSGLILAWRWGFRKASTCGASALIILTTLVAMQKPWRPAGSQHLVCSAVVKGMPVHVIQIHDGYGLNSTYIVAHSPSGRWKWFQLGNDDLYWRRAHLRFIQNGSLEISKYGKVFAVFDPYAFSLHAFGVERYPSHETWESPLDKKDD